MKIHITILFLISSLMGQYHGTLRDWKGNSQENCRFSVLRNGNATEVSVTQESSGKFEINWSGLNLEKTDSPTSKIKWMQNNLIIYNSQEQFVTVQNQNALGQVKKTLLARNVKEGAISIRGLKKDSYPGMFYSITLGKEKYVVRYGESTGHSQKTPSIQSLKVASEKDTLRIHCAEMAPEYIELTENENLGVVSVRPPNVIVIFLDDAGYGDFSIYGQTNYATPNIDAMANEGALFQNFYVAQGACSASRASLLTGTYASRFKFPWVVGPSHTQGLPENEKTLAELTKEKGYSTALFGKWHLGNKAGSWPLNHGFDEFFGIPRSADYNGVSLLEGNSVVTNYKGQAIKTNIGKSGGSVNGVPNYNDTAAQEMLTTWWTDKSIDFIERKENNPFFLYIAHNQPHTGLFVSDDFKGISGKGLYADVMMEIDHNVGRVLKKLKEAGLDKKTMVFFSSDNGPWLNYGDHSGSVGPFKPGFGKRTTHEGGVREPGIAWWPGMIPSGTVVETPAMTIDILPTVASVMGGNLPGHKIDGVDLSPVLFDATDSLPDRLLYFYKGQKLESVRYNQWKFHFSHNTDELNVPKNGGAPGSYKTFSQPEALYNLSHDKHESINVKLQNVSIHNYIKNTATTFHNLLTGSEGRPVQHY